jgi:hypothetical protein
MAFTKRSGASQRGAALPQARAMDGRAEFSQAGGVILATAIITGTVAGIIVGEPSIGFLVGLAAGGLLMLLFWLNERRR